MDKHVNDKDDALLWNDIGEYFKNRDNYETIEGVKGNNLWMISSTSWTPDEDLNMLLNQHVLKNIDDKISEYNNNTPRRIVLFITGKDEGNLRKQFETKLHELSLKNIDVITLWLGSPNNYVHLLKWCDIGLCFHLSSSGLDLPIKVVDMFGVGIPVIAINFNQTEMEKIMEISDINKNEIKTALNELVEHNKHGFIFNNSEELAKYILNIYNDIDDNISRDFKDNIEQFRKHKWNDQWRETMIATNCFDRSSFI